MNKRVIVLVVLLVVLIAAFAGCGSPAGSIDGLWYEETGFAGTMEFKSGGNCSMEAMGMKFDGKYTFDAAKGEGTIEIMEQKSSFKLENGKLNMDGAIYTREKVEQQGLDTLLEGFGDALEGLGTN